MPYTLGAVTKTKLLKLESHKLHHEFQVDDLKATITLTGDLSTSDVVNGKINGVAIAAVTFATDHDTTMDLLLAAVVAHPAVVSATLTDATDNRQITVVALDPNNVFVLPSADWTAVGGGATVITCATDTNNVYQGESVKLCADGKIEPCAAAETPLNQIGIAIQNGVGGELVTVMMKAYAITWAEAGTAALNAGPVKIHTGLYNTTTGYLEVDDASVTTANVCGWALDAATLDGDLVRLAHYV